MASLVVPCVFHEGKRIEKGRGSVTVPVLRTQANVEAEAIKTSPGEPSSFRVKDVSPLIPGFDIITGFPVDYMHAVYESHR